MAHPEPTGEAEEHHGSPWPVIIAIGMGVGYVGIVSVSIPMLLVGLAIFGGGLGGWIHQDLPRPSSASKRFIARSFRSRIAGTGWSTASDRCGASGSTFPADARCISRH